MGNLAVGISFLFGLQQEVGGDIGQLILLNFFFEQYQFLYLLQKPLVYFGELLNGFERNTHLKGIVDMEKTIARRMLQAVQYGLLVGKLAPIGTQAISFDFQRLTSLLEGFLEIASNAHYLSHRLHLQAQETIRPFELVEVPTGNFHNHIVQGRFKIGRGGFGNLIRQLVEIVANGQFGGNFGDGIARGLAGQSRGARHTRIDLDNDDVVVFGIYRKLYVAASGKSPDTVHHLDSQIAHFLIYLVGERHGGRYRDGIASMNAHRVKIFNRANDNHIARTIAQQFQFIFFPTHNTLLHQHLVDGRSLEPTGERLVELFRRMYKAAARAAQSIRRAYHQGEADFLGDFFAT